MAGRGTRNKATSSGDSSAHVGDKDMTSTIQTLRKWLKSLKVDSQLNISGKDIPSGLQHGILFLDYLRCMNFPQKWTASEDCLMRIIADLHVKIDQGSDFDYKPNMQINKMEIAPEVHFSKGKSKSENLSDDMQKQGPKAAGPKKGVRKLIPLSEAMSNLNIQENKGCACKSDCKLKLCGCRKRDAQCNPSCKCGEGCTNKTEIGKDIKAETVEVESVEAKTTEAKKVDKKKVGPRKVGAEKAQVESKKIKAKTVEVEQAKTVETKKADVKTAKEHKDLEFPDDRGDILSNSESEDTSSNSESEDTSSNSKSEDTSCNSEAENTFLDEGEDLEREYVDWNKHIATLIECPKCSRKFFAERVKYHAQVCKRI